MGTVVDDAAAAEFRAFFEAHYAELARLAHLLTGEADAADDLAADALMALWHRWDRVRGADHPAAYARGVVANLARTRIRSAGTTKLETIRALLAKAEDPRTPEAEAELARKRAFEMMAKY
ncbi:hypothetical protein DLE01_28260, partial [Streptomyces sp. FT05W]